MADEKLRRNLDRAFDPGPDFPHSLLLSRTMAMLEAEATRRDTHWKSNEQPQRRAWLSVALTRTGVRLVAGALVLLLVVAAVGVSLAIHEYARHSVPAQSHPKSGSRSCSQGNLHMVTSSTGWYGTFRTTDGGVTWKDVSPPSLPNENKGARVACFLDADHAWVTEVAGSSETRKDQLFVFATHDGGQTWRESNPVPITGGSPQQSGWLGGWPEAQLQFIDDRHGWLVTESSAYSTSGTTIVYMTTDGGLDWSEVATSSTPPPDVNWLWQLIPCQPTGMTFVSLSKGWLTWDCTTQLPPISEFGVYILTTNDGGHSWEPLRSVSNIRVQPPALLPSANIENCGASPPVFGGSLGVLPEICGARQTGSGYSAVFRTSDSSATWTVSLLPANVGLSQIDFVDANAGFVFVHTTTGNDLYRTTDAGRDWAIVKKGLFSGRDVSSYQFIDATTGFAYTDSSPGTVWKTADGGNTWSHPAP